MTNQAKTILGGWLGQAHSQGVGNMLACKCTRKNQRNSLKYYKYTLGKVRESLPTEDMS
jgi:hypothetical protein